MNLFLIDKCIKYTAIFYSKSIVRYELKNTKQTTEALEGHFSYYLQLICYSLIVITYLLMLT